MLYLTGAILADFGSQVVTSEEDVTALINYNSFLGYDVVFR